MHDIVIRGATVVDGTGNPRFGGDVAVAEGKIVAVGKVGAGRREIDATGLVVAPGFIDIHTHYDAQLGWDPLASSSCWHGVTTVVTGNCGYSLAPVRPADRRYTVELFSVVEGMAPEALEAGVDWDWETWPEWTQVTARKLGVNAAAFVGHTAVRRYVMGEAAAERTCTEDELAQMKTLVRQALAAGAAGFSTSRSPTHYGPSGDPVPSRLADESELMALIAVLGEFRQGVVGALPASATQGLNAQDRELLIEMALRSRRPVIAQGIGSLGYRWDDPTVWTTQQQFLSDCAARGAQIYGQAQANPSARTFTLKRTSLFHRLPAWKALVDAPVPDKQRLIADSEARARLRYEADNQREVQLAHGDVFTPIRWDLILVKTAGLPAQQPLEGRRLIEIARDRGRHQADTLLELAAEADFDTEFISTGWAPEDEASVATVLKNSTTIVGTSDGGAHLATMDGAEYSSYFLAYWVREKAIMSLEEAVRRLTTMPADVIGLTGRGCITEGYAADLVLFDPDRIRPSFKAVVNDLPAGAPRWFTRPEGVHMTLVNGKVLTENGEHCGGYPGQFLRPGQ